MIIGIAITKTQSFRGVAEEFSNVYHYDAAVGMDPSNLINAVAELERPIFSASVTFLRGNAWGPTDQGKLASQMLTERQLAGAGSATNGAAIYPELAAVVSWFTGRLSITGKPIFLRKYLHIANTQGANIGPAMADEPLSLTDINALTAYGNSVKNVTVGATQQVAQLTDKMGRGLPLGTDPKVLNRLRIREMKR